MSGDPWTTSRKPGKSAAEGKTLRVSRCPNGKDKPANGTRNPVSLRVSFVVKVLESSSVSSSSVCVCDALKQLKWTTKMPPDCCVFFGMWHSRFSWLVWRQGCVEVAGCNCTLTLFGGVNAACPYFLSLASVCLYREAINGNDKRRLTN